MMKALSDLTPLRDRAVSLSSRKQALLRAVLVEVEHNRCLIEACRFEEADVHHSARALRLVAKRLHTRALELFISEEPRSARLFRDIDRQLSEPNLPEADDAPMPRTLSVAQQIVWLYRRIVKTRALAEAHHSDPSRPGDDAMDIRFHVRLRNIVDASHELSHAIDQIQQLTIVETAATQITMLWEDVLDNWDSARQVFEALRIGWSEMWAALRAPSSRPEKRRLSSRSSPG